MTIIRILTVLFVIFVGSRAILRFKEKMIGYSEFFFWVLIWSAVLVITFNPGIADEIATLFGLRRGTDAMFFVAVMIIFYLIFRLYVKLDTIDRDITRLNSSTSKAMYDKDSKS